MTDLDIDGPGDRDGDLIGDRTDGQAHGFVWEAPGPGEWSLDTTHHGARPVSHYFRGLNTEAFARIGVMFEKYGLPLEGMDLRTVNELDYFRPRGVGEGSKPKPPPPVWLMKIVARLHPELRRRNRAAADAWASRLWRHEVDRWFDDERPDVLATNRRLGAIDPRSLDDQAVLTHLDELNAHLRIQAVAAMEGHGGDIIPVGDYLAHCAGWGISDHEACTLLRGASPATIATATVLSPVATALAAGATPATIDDVRAIGPSCAEAVDRWLLDFGWRLISTDDVDGRTLVEHPELLLQALLSAVAPPTNDDVDPGPIRIRVPLADRERFDELLAEARYGLRQRDDAAGLRWTWPAGLVRRALLEVGRRLVERGALVEAAHAVDLEPHEVAPLLRQGRGPSATEVAERLARRLAVEAASPPERLGEPEPPPPFDALPPAMARAARAMLAFIDAMEGVSSVDSASSSGGDDASAPGFGRGMGVGDTVYEGRARVVREASEAFDRLQPGEVLVAPFTGPGYNALLPMVGAIVVEFGGPMSHAAIVAREFGLPTVIGANGATTELNDGDLVRVDPVEGRVTVVAPA